MVNRVIQAKVMKQKRMRRAWAKPYSMRSMGPHPSPGFVNERGDFTDIGFGSRTKVARSHFDMYLISKYSFHPNSTEAIYARTRGLHADLAADREIVLVKRTQSRGTSGPSLEKERTYVYQVMKQVPNYEIRLYILGDSSFFIASIVTKTERIYKRSVEYPALHVARDDYAHDRILWDVVDRQPLVPSS